MLRGGHPLGASVSASSRRAIVFMLEVPGDLCGVAPEALARRGRGSAINSPVPAPPAPASTSCPVAVHRCGGREMVVRLSALPRAVVELREAGVAVGDEGAHAELAGDPTQTAAPPE